MKARELLSKGFDSLLDAIMPPRARSARTRERKADDIPLEPTDHDLLGTRVTTLMNYRRAEVQDLIRALKYDRSGHAAKIAADLLADYLREEIASLRTFSAKTILLIPVPLHKSRMRERGYNQIELVLNALPQEFKDGTLSHLSLAALIRAKQTTPQTKLSRAERIKNLVGAFECPHRETIANAHVFLIDDVTTTGATLLHAGTPLKAAGGGATLLALARA